MVFPNLVRMYPQHLMKNVDPDLANNLSRPGVESHIIPLCEARFTFLMRQTESPAMCRRNRLDPDRRPAGQAQTPIQPLSFEYQILVPTTCGMFVHRCLQHAG